MTSFSKLHSCKESILMIIMHHHHHHHHLHHHHLHQCNLSEFASLHQHHCILQWWINLALYFTALYHYLQCTTISVLYSPKQLLTVVQLLIWWWYALIRESILFAGSCAIIQLHDCANPECFTMCNCTYMCAIADCKTYMYARVAKCFRYGRYICVKISKSWGKKFVGIQNR